jgi:spoIIIJ-associated protein
MRSVEVEGDSIDDAIRTALAELGITRDRAAIEILNDASRGILWFGGRKARVRATVRAPLSEALAAIEEPVRPRPKVSRETDMGSDADRPVRQPGRSAAAPASVSRETRSEGRGSTPNIESPPAAGPIAAAPAPSGELAARSREILLEMLSHLGVGGEVSLQPTADGVAVSLGVRCESSALLIGKRGQTLDAIEYLLNRIVIREAAGNARIEVDVEGYRARREESLSALARRLAEKVRKTGKPATVDLMNPRDRRVVHMALRDEGGVTSRSQGEGFLRKLVIIPAGKRRGGGRPAADGE